jgi:hypothetical protein
MLVGVEFGIIALVLLIDSLFFHHTLFTRLPPFSARPLYRPDMSEDLFASTAASGGAIRKYDAHANKALACALEKATSLT